ncbi:Bcr/CflA family efflux MFS transporter [Variovorax arabinosiphilus]|uniref:Bcr/CflA family efflux MFS transporter n=1 Tax=Variovorax arabinosiphilus TaxID=3053498 RepID=UPI002574A4C2|nr:MULTISPECIES: Bcr/CflA family efflux MFS transporter [unclassified Variovorax]MDM0119654.1 Bcr/CflA family efflux MFS transporter [Variovorax sp. J2L1-78]MDM0128434.1 Bcr/CflA family efflux MFS transporter [Variovorax sp. J2L1-63]MDM0232134.1 Bcr/CflA family efflux MFS transporter [Variovorax sp. J2R1-6]
MSVRGHAPSPATAFVLLLPLLLAAQPVATDSYLPALPEIARDLGSASASLTAFVLAFGIAQLVCGPLSDRFGRRPVLLTGLAVYAIAAAGAIFSPSMAVLVGFRVLQGFSMAAILVCARAAVRDLYPAHEGPHVMARGLTGLGVVGLIAPVMGAFTVQEFGWRWVLGGMAVYAALLWVLCLRLFGETLHRPGAGEPATPKGSVREVFASPSFRAWASVAATTYSGIFAFLLLSPMVYIGYLGLSPIMYGWIPAGGSLVYIFSTTMCRRLLRRLGVVHTVQLGATLSCTGPLIQVVGCVLAPQSVVPLLVGHAVYCLGHGIHQPCGQAGAVGDLPHLAGRAVSWSGFGMMLVGFVVGQTAASFVDPQSSNGAWPMVVPMLLAGMVLMLIAFFWVPRLPAPSTARRP